MVVRKGRRVLLVQRPGEGRWAGMWEFPHGEVANGARPIAAAARLSKALTGVETDRPAEWLTVRHSVTRHRITMRCFQATYRAGRFRSPFYVRGRWVEPARLHEYPVSVPQRMLARALLNGTI